MHDLDPQSARPGLGRTHLNAADRFGAARRVAHINEAPAAGGVEPSAVGVAQPVAQIGRGIVDLEISARGHDGTVGLRAKLAFPAKTTVASLPMNKSFPISSVPVKVCVPTPRTVSLAESSKVGCEPALLVRRTPPNVPSESAVM